MEGSPEQIVKLGEMMQALKAGDICSLSCITYSAQRRTGGHWLDILEARMLIATPKTDSDIDKLDPGIRGRADGEPMEKNVTKTDERKNPHHFDHGTINLRLYANGQPTSRIHKTRPDLIMIFNGRTVI